MGPKFDNGIDLSNCLWRVAHHPGVSELLKGDGEALIEPNLSEIVREHNAVVAKLAERLSAVTHFQFSEHVSIVWRMGNLWSVYEGGMVLNVDGNWEYDPLPSSRTDEFKARTRFSLEEAFERATADARSARL